MWRMSVPRPYLGGRASGLPAASSTGPPLVRGIRADPSTKWRGDRWKRPFDFPILQKFAVIGHHDPVPFGIFDLLDIHLKVDGAHDTVPEHLVDERFNSRTVDLRDLVEPVDERINGYSTVERALHGQLLQRFSHLRTEPQDTRCGRSFVGRHGRLAHQGRSDPDLMPSHSFGNGLKGKSFGFLGSQDLNSSLCASDHDIFLLSMMVNRVTATLFLTTARMANEDDELSRRDTQVNILKDTEEGLTSGPGRCLLQDREILADALDAQKRHR